MRQRVNLEHIPIPQEWDVLQIHGAAPVRLFALREVGVGIRRDAKKWGPFFGKDMLKQEARVRSRLEEGSLRSPQHRYLAPGLGS
jgi:hypothetical protein